jgi:hypothetical protein
VSETSRWPTPDVLGIEHAQHDGELRSFSIQRLVPDRSPDRVEVRLIVSDAANSLTPVFATGRLSGECIEEPVAVLDGTLDQIGARGVSSQLQFLFRHSLPHPDGDLLVRRIAQIECVSTRRHLYAGRCPLEQIRNTLFQVAMEPHGNLAPFRAGTNRS